MTRKPIAEEIQELRVLPVPELVERYELVFGKPPRVKHRDWLWRRVAWKVQEQRFGGLSTVARRRLDELIDQLAASGKAVLMVSSYLPELLGVCDRIAVMRRGKLGEARPVAELTEHSVLTEAVAS